jgi:ABC-type tungstate transport system substrate-binding protein
MRDIGYLAIFLVFAAIIAFSVAWSLAKWAQRLSRRRILLIASLSVPTVLIGLSIYSFVMVSTMTAEQCGVDACGYAILGATILAGLAVLTGFLGWAVAVLAYRMARAPK